MPKLLLTGRPGCGKTTLLRGILERLSMPAGGFYTQEKRQAEARVGFEIVTLDGRRGVLADVGLRSTARLGKYGVHLQSLDELGVGSIRRAMEAGRLVVIDEIGPMEMLSPSFRQAVLDVVNSPASLLGTIVQRSTPFGDLIKRRPEITLIEVRPDNQEALIEKVLERLSGA